MTLEKFQKAAARALERHQSAKRAAAAEREALEGYKSAQHAATEAQKILQSVASAVQHQAHAQITAVVTKCLEVVFPGAGYSFRINFDRKRGKTDARMVFVKRGVEVDPTSADSGGVLQVAAFGLRLSCLLLAVPKKRKLIVLDEPFSMVSKEYVPALAELLEVLARDLGVQFVLVTHNADLHVGEVIKVGDKT